jgi:hypothetical protein
VTRRYCPWRDGRSHRASPSRRRRTVCRAAPHSSRHPTPGTSNVDPERGRSQPCRARRSASANCSRRPGISTIVVMNSSAPELQGVQSVPLHPVPSVLLTALGRQSDLALVLQTKSVEVFSNSLFRGIVNDGRCHSARPRRRRFSRAAPNTGPVDSNGASVAAGYAPASAFGLEVDGQSAPRAARAHHGHLSFKSAPTAVGGGEHSVGPNAQLVLQRLPLNALLAGFTLIAVAVGVVGLRVGPPTGVALHGSTTREAATTRSRKRSVNNLRRVPLLIVLAVALARRRRS